MDNYEQQAQDFLTETGTTLVVEYSYTGQYFPGDQGHRCVYRFTLKNARGEYTATYGDSIINTRRPKHLRVKPSAYSILAAIGGHDIGTTFEEFCSDYEYDALPMSEYPRVMQIYTACQAEAAGVRRLFTEEELGRLADIN